MKINTRKFGELEIDDGKVLVMPEGLPGFPGFERFVLLEDPKSAPFCWFQSVESPNLSLVIMSPFVFMPDYRIDLKRFIASRGWKDERERDLLIYVVINVSETGEEKKITANLMGPIIINPSTNEAIQVVISDTTYSHQHDVMASAEKLARKGEKKKKSL